MYWTRGRYSAPPLYLWGCIRIDMHNKDSNFARLDTTVRVHNLNANNNFAAERNELPLAA